MHQLLISFTAILTMQRDRINYKDNKMVALLAATLFAVISVTTGIEGTEATWNTELRSNLRVLNYERNDVTTNSDSCSGMSSSKSDIRFILCRYDEQPVEIAYDDPQSLQKSGFDQNKKTFVITDGFISNFSSPMSQAMCHYLPISKKTSNVIIVDWGKLSGSTATKLNLSDLVSFFQIYLCALANSLAAGNRIAEMIQFLNVNSKNVHLIGHSLGADVSRIAADDYKDIAKTKVSRVTFLDPASPTCDFSGKEQGGLISVHYVDAHHTNMGGLGTRETLCGGLDIFYNGGSHQPGCPVANPPTLSSEYCSHTYSWRSFIASFTQPLYAGHCKIDGDSQKSSANCFNSTEPEKFVSKLQVGLNMRNQPSGAYAVYNRNAFPLQPPPYIIVKA